MLVFSFILFFITGISVTAGYHRSYSHNAYKLNNKVAEVCLLFLATMAGQGSAIRWSFEHRHHHAYVDTDRDPYSIKKGFWFAHILWLFRKQDPVDPKVVSDLFKSPLLAFQHKYYPWLFFGTNAFVFAVTGWVFGDFLGAFVLSWWARLFFSHHTTWCINSLAHFWGSQSFSKELSAVDNYVLSIITFGEGYHNYHHTFANDYRNGIRWYHFDPTKWLIWTLSKLGMAQNLRKVSPERIQERIDRERNENLQKAQAASSLETLSQS